MGHEPGHPRAEPHLWPVLSMGSILALQVVLTQVAVNRLAWGMYKEVFSPAVATAGLAILSWVLYSQLDRDTL
jgi:hypothetical protein